MSSGTILSVRWRDERGSVGIPIDARFKPDRGREEVIVMGHVTVKSTAQLDAADLTLRTIKCAVITPAFGPSGAMGGPAVMYGSVNQSGSLQNSLTLRTVQGSQSASTGTVHVGTVKGGTMQASFFILGA